VKSVVNGAASRVLSSFVITYYADGRPKTVLGTGGAHVYKYTNDGAMNEECFTKTCSGTADPVVRYTYDGVGNRKTMKRRTGLTTYTYDAADGLLTAIGPQGTTKYTYDLQGNRSSAGTSTYPHNLANELTAASVDGRTVRYTYDGLGQLARTIKGPLPTDATAFVWDYGQQPAQLALEADGRRTPLRRYVNAGSTPLLLDQRAGTFSYLTDWRGNIATVVNANGRPSANYGYDYFGAPRLPTDTRNTETSSPLTNPRGFLAGYTDSTTGFISTGGGPNYDPTTGQTMEQSTLPPGVDPGSNPCGGNCPRDCYMFLACGPRFCFGLYEFCNGGGGGTGGGGTCDPATADCSGSGSCPTPDGAGIPECSSPCEGGLQTCPDQKPTDPTCKPEEQICSDQPPDNNDSSCSSTTDDWWSGFFNPTNVCNSLCDLGATGAGVTWSVCGKCKTISSSLLCWAGTLYGCYVLCKPTPLPPCVDGAVCGWLRAWSSGDLNFFP
jgi:YD repeat-containing protein